MTKKELCSLPYFTKRSGKDEKVGDCWQLNENELSVISQVEKFLKTHSENEELKIFYMKLKSIEPEYEYELTSEKINLLKE